MRTRYPGAIVQHIRSYAKRTQRSTLGWRLAAVQIGTPFQPRTERGLGQHSAGRSSNGPEWTQLLGKPYAQELARLAETISQVAQTDHSRLVELVCNLADQNLVAVGSGGSFSAALFASALHEALTGRIAKAVTPLELAHRTVTRNTAALLVSARGSNSDILSSFETATSRGYSSVSAICAAMNSPLRTRFGGEVSERYFEFSPSVARDGFLATNSLIATVSFLSYAYHRAAGCGLPDMSGIGMPPIWYLTSDLDRVVLESVLRRQTIFVLYSGWSAAAAHDIESKFSEAALGHVVLADFRSFAHGRHYWISSRDASSAIIALSDPGSKVICEATLKLLPKSVPAFRLATERTGPAGGIDLLARALFLVGVSGQVTGADPGRPSVATFGRELYALRPRIVRRPSVEAVWAAKKTMALGRIGQGVERIVSEALSQYLNRLSSVALCGVVVDYDGTLVTSAERESGPRHSILEALVRLADAGAMIGIATGRGPSVYRALRKALPPGTWQSVILGMYNGASIQHLGQALTHPHGSPSEGVAAAEKLLKPHMQRLGIPMEIRPAQITLTPPSPVHINELRQYVAAQLEPAVPGLKVWSSSHSIDVTNAETTKLRVVHAVREQLQARARTGQISRLGTAAIPPATTSSCFPCHHLSLWTASHHASTHAGFLAPSMNEDLPSPTTIFAA